MAAADLRDRTYELLCRGGSIYAARQSGLYRYSALGSEPEQLYQSWLPGQAMPTLALGAAEAILLAGINGGVARSEDGGNRWEALQFALPAPLVTCLALSPEFARDGCLLAGSYEDGVFRSSDGGRSWLAFNHGLYDHNIYCLALSPGFSADSIVFAGTSSGIYRSENGGRLWQDLVMPAGDETVLSLALSPTFAEDGIIYAGCESHGLLRSNDGGGHWETWLETDGAVNQVLLAADGEIVLLVNDELLLGDGQRWRELAAGGVDCVALGEDGARLLLGMANGEIEELLL